MKRIVREIFRKNRALFGTCEDFLVNIRSGADRRTYQELERELLGSVARHVRVRG
jgi:ribonuclease P protein component